MSRFGHDPLEFGTSDDVYRGYDLHEEETARGPLILALAAGVLIVFGAVVWNTYRQGVRSEAGALPVIAADETPYRRRPDDAGGAVTPDLDRRFYDEMDGSSRPAVDPDAPLRRSVSSDDVETLQGGSSDVVVGDGPMDLRPPRDEAGSDTASALPPPRGSLDQQAETLAELGGRPATGGDGERIAALDPATAALAAREASPPVSPAPVATPTSEAPLAAPAATAPRFEFSVSGSYLVQIAALRDEAAADRAWSQLVSRQPALMAGADKRIQRADLGARGIFYRLRAGAFETREAASAFCEALKSSGNECIVVQ